MVRALFWQLDHPNLFSKTEKRKLAQSREIGEVEIYFLRTTKPDWDFNCSVERKAYISN